MENMITIIDPGMKEVIRKYSTCYISLMRRSRGVTGGLDPPPPPPPEKSQKYWVAKQYWSVTPDNLQSYQASIQSWPIIGPPAERLNGVSLVV